MPKQTFFNLPTKKQEDLIEVAKKEFSRVPLNEASISNIVKSAGIPRGSFYQYFEDKEDAFYYILELHSILQRGEFILILERNNRDIFAAFVEFFKESLQAFEKQENQAFYKNAFLNMNYEIENKIKKSFNKEKIDQQLKTFLTHVDMNLINISDEKEMFRVIEIFMAITMQNLMNHFAKRYSFEEAVNNYKLDIALLRKGLGT